MLVRTVPTHSGVLGIFSFGAPSVVLQTVEVDEHTVTEECKTRGRTLRLTALLEIRMSVGARGREQLLS